MNTIAVLDRTDNNATLNTNMQEFSLKKAQWFCTPKQYELSENTLRVSSEPHTDFWQQTYYGFVHDNAHLFCNEVSDLSFSFTVKTDFSYKKLFDQCGIAVYIDSENWFKACAEYNNDQPMWLGSVVTKNAYSDWASSELPANISSIWYRLSRRNQDYLIEYSLDGERFKQMRIFHFPDVKQEKIKLGLMLASPGESSFEAIFSDISMTACLWQDH